MTKLSLREAAKTFDVSRPTLTKALKIGKISGEQDATGGWKVDYSELARVYQVRLTNTVNTGEDEPVNVAGTDTSFTGEVERLKAALLLAETRAEAAERLAQERAERIEDLRRMLPSPKGALRSQRREWWPWNRTR